jgi:hypothetical protein
MKGILKGFIVLLFLYSRYTFYADAYPKIEMTKQDSVIKQVIQYLKTNADFQKAFSQGVNWPPENSVLQKVEEYISTIPAIKNLIDEARKQYNDKFQSHFLTEVYRGIFGTGVSMLSISQHFSAKSLLYDTIMLSVLMYFIYKESMFANVLLFGDALYKTFLLCIYHLRETPLEKFSNYMLGFFTNLKTMNIEAMFKSYGDILADHRSIISTFIYVLLLASYMYLYGTKVNLPRFEKENPHVTTTRIGGARETARN